MPHADGPAFSAPTIPVAECGLAGGGFRMSFWKDLGKSIGDTLEGMAEADKQLAPSKSLFESMVLMNESSARNFLRNLARTQNDTDRGRLSGEGSCSNGNWRTGKEPSYWLNLVKIFVRTNSNLMKSLSTNL
jgi:hypothetical protein